MNGIHMIEKTARIRIIMEYPLKESRIKNSNDTMANVTMDRIITCQMISILGIEYLLSLTSIERLHLLCFFVIMLISVNIYQIYYYFIIYRFL